MKESNEVSKKVTKPNLLSRYKELEVQLSDALKPYHPPENYEYPTTMVGVKNPKPRRCNGGVFKDYPLMHYDESHDKIYCSCCKAAISNNNYKKYNEIGKTPFSATGFCRWQDLGPSLVKHHKSKLHTTARDYFARIHLDIESRESELIDSVLNQNLSSEQKENKEFLCQSFLATRLLSK